MATEQVLRSRTQALDAADPWSLLAAGRGGPRMAWHAAKDAWVALGAAWTVTGRGRDRFDIVRHRAKQAFSILQHDARGLPDGVGPRFVGGVSFFDNHRPDGLWPGFHAARFWLPARLVQWIDGQAYETTVEADPAQEPMAPFADDAGPAGTDSRTVWTGRAARTMRSMDRLQLQKTVLARTARAPAADPEGVLRRLAAHERGTTRYLVEPDGGTALVGATPERLAHLADGTLTTHALAGSVVRGPQDASDEDAGRRLMLSGKDEAEHELVKAHILVRLRTLHAQAVRSGKRRVRRLRSIQHLETPIEADLDADILEVVKALHPTPAVAGAPVDQSLKLIDHLEPVPRGWYSGAIGWFDAAGQGSFAVALRCALLRQDGSWLYAGAGLLPESEPGKEWEETEAKMQAIRDALEAS